MDLFYSLYARFRPRSKAAPKKTTYWEDDFVKAVLDQARQRTFAEQVAFGTNSPAEMGR